MKLCEWDSDEDGTRDPNGCAEHATEKVDDNSGDEWALCAKHSAEARHQPRTVLRDGFELSGVLVTHADTHPEVTTLGQCTHARHRHGWWCGRCLRAMVPGVVVTQCAGDKWVASWRLVGGYGSNAVRALQSCIEAARMDGAP